MMPNTTEFSEETDLLLIDAPTELLNRIHSEVMLLSSGFIRNEGIDMIADRYGAEAFLKEDTTYYLFRFKTAHDKLAFLLKNV